MIGTTLSPKFAPVAAEGAKLAATGRKRILLVEGDGFTRLVLLLRLRLAGFAVDFTSNGTLGLGKLRGCHPDILLVELKLCGLSGLELIKAARAEPTFNDRPIFVFTHVDRMHRTTRREVDSLGTTVIDKKTVTREDLVQIFATTFPQQDAREEKLPAITGAEPPAQVLSEVVVSGAIQAVIAGVRDQSEVFARETGPGVASGAELLSRVCSLASCAKAAYLPNLARHAKALENFLKQLCENEQTYTSTALSTVTRAVEVMSGMSLETNGKQQSPTKFAVVFVDEATYSSRAMEEALVQAGFEPTCFKDPGKAREYLGSHRTKLIIANVVLPEGHGLTLGDIRTLSLHARTPVLFGPESTGPSREDLPTGARRLDKAPVLLAELVVMALNEVQSDGASSAASPAVARPAPSPASQPIVRPRAEASLPAEDGFELFSKAPRQETASATDSSAEGESVPANAIRRHLSFNHRFTAAGIPSEPILRAQPGTPGEDGEAEPLAQSPETTIDGTLVDDRPVEELQPSDLQSEASQPAQPEAMSTDQSAESHWLAVAAGDVGQTVPETNSASELEQNAVAAVEESSTATPNNVEAMNNQLQSELADHAPQSEESQPDQAVNDQRNRHEELATRVCAAEMALYHAQEDIQGRDQAIESLQKQLAEAKAGQLLAADKPAAPNVVERMAQARCAELEEEVAALRQAFEGLNGGLGAPLQGSDETGKHAQELEQHLIQKTAELENQQEEQRRAEADLRAQLEAANAAGKQSDAAREQAEARCAQLEQELGEARQVQKELPKEPAQDQKASAEPGAQQKQSSPAEGWSGAPASELEQQVCQGVAALARATAELAIERGERQRNQQRAAELNGRLQVLHQDFSRTLQAQREDLARLSALEEQQHQTSQALDRCAADVEQHQAERRLAEEQLQKAKEANAQLRKDLSFFEEANKKFGGARQELQTRLEAGLGAALENEARLQQETAERQRLAQGLEEARRELQNQSRRHQALEQELQNTRDALQDREAKLQKETGERQRLDDAQDFLQHGLQANSERDLEFSKLQSALQLEQVERKRQETQLARTRQSALDSAHAARSLRTSLRRQVREPVENLVHSARSLLEQEMGEAQKKLAEAVLQDVLLVQTRLREPAVAQADAPEAAAPPATTAA